MSSRTWFREVSSVILNVVIGLATTCSKTKEISRPWITWARPLSLARSKLRLCSANHMAGYFSNLACDWLSIVWAYSEQETDNWPWSTALFPGRPSAVRCQDISRCITYYRVLFVILIVRIFPEHTISQIIWLFDYMWFAISMCRES